MEITRNVGHDGTFIGTGNVAQIRHFEKLLKDNQLLDLGLYAHVTYRNAKLSLSNVEGKLSVSMAVCLCLYA